MNGWGFRQFYGTGLLVALHAGIWNALMLAIWAFGITSGVLLALAVGA